MIRIRSGNFINNNESGNKYITFATMKYSELFRLLAKDGWFTIRQTGSHVIMKHPVKTDQLTVPFHKSKDVNKGLLAAILKKAEIKTSKR